MKEALRDAANQNNLANLRNQASQREAMLKEQMKESQLKQEA